MKIIFLDIDGVLNYHGYGGNFRATLAIDCITQLNAITDATQAQIVISSTWRKTYPLAGLIAFLREQGVTGHILDSTPNLNGLPRGEEIAQWINAHPGVENFVILDDDSDMCELTSYLVQTSIYAGGLQATHAQRAIAILNHG